MSTMGIIESSIIALLPAVKENAITVDVFLQERLDIKPTRIQKPPLGSTSSPLASSSSSAPTFCKSCGKFIPSQSWEYHLKSPEHLMLDTPSRSGKNSNKNNSSQQQSANKGRDAGSSKASIPPQVRKMIDDAKNISTNDPGKAAGMLWAAAKAIWTSNALRETAETLVTLLNILNDANTITNTNTTLSPSVILETQFQARLALARIFALVGNPHSAIDLYHDALVGRFLVSSGHQDVLVDLAKIAIRGLRIRDAVESLETVGDVARVMNMGWVEIDAQFEILDVLVKGFGFDDEYDDVLRKWKKVLEVWSWGFCLSVECEDRVRGLRLKDWLVKNDFVGVLKKLRGFLIEVSERWLKADHFWFEKSSVMIWDDLREEMETQTKVEDESKVFLASLQQKLSVTQRNQMSFSELFGGKDDLFASFDSLGTKSNPAEDLVLSLSSSSGGDDSKRSSIQTSSSPRPSFQSSTTSNFNNSTIINAATIGSNNITTSTTTTATTVQSTSSTTSKPSLNTTATSRNGRSLPMPPSAISSASITVPSPHSNSAVASPLNNTTNMSMGNSTTNTKTTGSVTSPSKSVGGGIGIMGGSAAAAAAVVAS
ncbi:hypothetical protein HDU76_007722, partial [Blyttiomyces sp. JEL0837]